MATTLRYVIVIPAGGGKTTLYNGNRDVFLDVDALYNLRETESTYERMNKELQLRATVKQPVPASIAEELRSRVQHYHGPACCLLVHSVKVAEKTGLKIVAVLVPSRELHEASILDRDDIGRWFVRQNASCLVEDCQERSLHVTRYPNWEGFTKSVATIMGSLLEDKARKLPCLGKKMICTPPARMQQERDEALLLALCSIAIGCSFEPST